MRVRNFQTLALFLLLGWAIAGTGRAQNVLVVEHKGKAQVVRAAREGRALVEINGKLVVADGTRFLFTKAEEYAPFFVSVRDAKAGLSYTEIANRRAEINQSFQFRADFTSPYHLQRVFLVLELDSKDGGKSLFIWEVGELQPLRSKPLNVAFATGGRIGPGNYVVHLFSNGAELFHSLMPFTEVEAALDRMIARRVQGAPDGGVKPFVGPTPEYPEKLLKDRTQGEAVIEMRIAGNGRVMDPVIKSATVPEFGESALVAVRQWRFLPKIENGQPVEMKVAMPFAFSPPAGN